MAVHYIAVSHEQEPVRRRSSRHIPSPSVTTQTPNPTRKRSRQSSELQEETEEESSPIKSPARSRRQRQVSTISVSPTPQPTPRAIRAQKRRKIADEATDVAATSVPSSSPSSLSTTTSSPSLSPPAPQPNPVSPEPISPSSNSASTSSYVIKTRAGKRKFRHPDEERNSESSSSGSASDSNTLPGDPLPRSLAKRRRVVRPRVSSSSSSSSAKLSLRSPPTTMTRKRRKTPRGFHASEVRRSARLQSLEKPEAPTVDADPFPLPDDALSIPMSPLTPPPDEDDDDDESPTPSPEPQPEPLEPCIVVKEPIIIEEAKPTEAECFPCLEVIPVATPLIKDDADIIQTGEPQEDEDDMEMIASIDISNNNSSSPSPAAAAKFRSVIPAHISNPVLKGRLPPNPLLYSQFQLAAYARTKPNTPSPLSLYSYTGNTPPPSPVLSATAALDVLDDIPSLGPSAAAAFVEAGVSLFVPIPEQYSPFDQQQFFEQQAQQGQYTTAPTPGYVQEGQQQSQQQQQQTQVYDQSQQQEYSQLQAPTSSSTTTTESMLDMGFMMDIQMQLQLQQMQMSSSVNGFQLGVENMMPATGTEASSNQQLPTTVNMQDVHLHQQSQGLEVSTPDAAQYGYVAFFGQGAQDQFGTYGQSGQQQQQQQQQQSPPQAQQSYGTPQFQPSQDYQSQQQQQQQQPTQFQPQYQQQEYRHVGYDASAQSQVYDASSSQVAQGYDAQQQQQQQQQHFQPQPPFGSSNTGYDGYATSQTSPSTPTSVPNGAATLTAAGGATTSHYTLAMHNALLYFQQTLSRFHDQQQLSKQDAEQAHARQLIEFQREKEEKKRRLKKTKLITRISSCAMSLYSAYRAKSLWSLACKARMWEVVRRYSPDLIREVTELSARDYHRRMGLKYPYPRRRRRMAKVRQEGSETLGAGGEGRKVVVVTDDAPPAADATVAATPVVVVVAPTIDKPGPLEDDDEFRKEKIFDFELFDDDEMDEGKKRTEGDEDDDEDDSDEDDDDEMVDDDEVYDDDDDDDDDEDIEEEDGFEFDATDPLFNQELSMRIENQGVFTPSSAGQESTFYVPPPQMVSPQNCVINPQTKTDEESTYAANSPLPTPKRKVMVVQRPVLSFPPPELSTFRPQALKLYNIDPVHAGRGTPSVRERRELWAGGKLPPFPVIQPRASALDDLDSATSATTTTTDVASCVEMNNVGEFVVPGCVTTYYAFTDDVVDFAPLPPPPLVAGGAATTTTMPRTVAMEDTASTPTLVRQVTTDEGSSSSQSSSSSAISCAHPVDESAVSLVAAAAADTDTEFGDCVGSCCLSEKAKGKRRAVEEEVEVEEKGADGSSGREFEGCFQGLVDDDNDNGTARREAQNDNDNGSGSGTLLACTAPCESIILDDGLPPSPEEDQSLQHQQTLHHHHHHQTVELTPAIPDRIPPRRRAVPGRCELLKVYEPPLKPTPSMVPFARRPPRPLPLEDNPVLRLNGLPYHPVTPYSWEQVGESLDFLACHGIDAGSWADIGNLSELAAPTIVLSGTEVQPTFHSSSSELSAALG